MPWRSPHLHFPHLVPAVALAASNLAAWLRDFNAGAFLSAASLLVLGGIALIGTALDRGLAQYSRYRKARVQLDLEVEELRKGSLSAQMEDMRAEMAASCAALAARLEDANAKLHDERRARQADALDKQRLHDELKLVMDMLDEAKSQVAAVNAQLAQVRGELDVAIRKNIELSARLSNRVAANTEAIQAIQGQSGELRTTDFRPPNPAPGG
jgi:chromosome segregation ATPase